MSLATLDAAGRFRHGGGHIFGPIILLIIVAVVVVMIVQRRRDRRTLHDTTPPRATSAPAPSAEPAPTSALGEDGGVVLAGPATRSAVVEVPTMATHEPLPPGRYGLGGLIASEWTKVRSVRSTMWTLAITIVLGIGLSALVTAESRAHWSTMTLMNRATFDPTAMSLVGVFVAQFAIGVLGALVVSAEYGTGTIRATFSAAPLRRRVHLAKVLVFGALALVVAEFVAFVAFFLGQSLLTSPATHATLSTPDALRAVVGSGVYVTLLGLIALGLAVIIRNSSGAISAFVGILLVLPLIVNALPSSLAQDIHRFMPSNIGANLITTVGPLPRGAFSAGVGILLLCVYAVALNVVGSILLTRRDA